MTLKFNPLLKLGLDDSSGEIGISQASADARYLKIDASNDPVTGLLEIVPPTTTTSGLKINAPSGYASDAHLLDLQINGTRKIGVDWQGYLTAPTHTIRFKRNDSTTAYLELKSEGPNGFGAINMSGTDVLSRSSTGVDFGDFAGVLINNFRGSTLNFFMDSQLANWGSTSNTFRWNNFGLAHNNALWVGQNDFVGNTNFMFRAISTGTARRIIASKAIDSQTGNHYEALPSGSEVPGFAVDSAFKVQFGDGAGTAVDTNLYRSTADTLKTDDNLHVVGEIEIDGALNHDGSTVGFYGTAPTSQQVLATGAGATVDNVITALQNLGLVKQS